METVNYVLLTCLCLACGEVLNGIFRLRYLARWLGKPRAQAVSVMTGLLLATAVCVYFSPYWGVRSAEGLAMLGLALAVFMAAFDVAVGRVLFHRPWHLIANDFDPRSGNYLSIGLVALGFVPWLVGQF